MLSSLLLAVDLCISPAAECPFLLLVSSQEHPSIPLRQARVPRIRGRQRSAHRLLKLAAIESKLLRATMTSKIALAAGQYGNARRPAIHGVAKVLLLVLAQVAHASAAPLKELFGLKKEEPAGDAKDPSMWLYLAVAAVLVLLGGAFAGLTIA